MKSALELIAEEAERQVTKEGYTPEHDDDHTDGELANAAGCYALTHAARSKYQSFNIVTDSWFPRWWPWHPRYWKPTPNNRIKELVKAGALIVKEIERLQRLEE